MISFTKSWGVINLVVLENCKQVDSVPITYKNTPVDYSNNFDQIRIKV